MYILSEVCHHPNTGFILNYYLNKVNLRPIQLCSQHNLKEIFGKNIICIEIKTWVRKINGRRDTKFDAFIDRSKTYKGKIQFAVYKKYKSSLPQ